ncbi:MAG TPA: VCBS repeat-containing protein [Kofleriaceae bacterium]|nr:VCBS repeat-containing protein [Kofleriaceae bacterium]
MTLTVDGDRAVPDELDAICVGVADRDLTGGAFGRTYRLEGRLGRLPQTLAVEAGQAGSALAWARGYRGGVAVAQDVASMSFDGDVTLRLDRCPQAHTGTITETAMVAAPAVRLVASMGQGGTVAVAVDGSGATVIDADGATLTGTALAAGGATVVAFDADGDCDDDLAVATAATLTLFTRDGTTFTAGATFLGAAALVAFDADRDGDQDLVAGAGAGLAMYENDGVGGFTAAAAGTIDDGNAVTAVSALAAGDLDGDGNADLIVGQAGAPPVVLVGDASGTGVLALAPAVFPPVSLTVRDLAPADVDGDLDLDVVVVLDGAPARVYVNRDGRLEDQSFIRLPQPAPAATGAAAGDWDGDCAPDLVLAAAATPALRGGSDGVFLAESALASAAATVLADIDDDGDPDLLLAGGGAVRWYRR